MIIFRRCGAKYLTYRQFSQVYVARVLFRNIPLPSCRNICFKTIGYWQNLLLSVKDQFANPKDATFSSGRERLTARTGHMVLALPFPICSSDYYLISPLASMNA